MGVEAAPWGAMHRGVPRRARGALDSLIQEDGGWVGGGGLGLGRSGGGGGTKTK